MKLLLLKKRGCPESQAKLTAGRPVQLEEAAAAAIVNQITTMPSKETERLQGAAAAWAARRSTSQ